MSDVLLDAASVVRKYLILNYSGCEQDIVWNEILEITGNRAGNDAYPSESYGQNMPEYGYERFQEILSCLNEKESIRKTKGVYYTPSDIVRFILLNSARLACENLSPETIRAEDYQGILPEKFCFEMSVYDPTCGTGVFLLEALDLKLDMLKSFRKEPKRDEIRKIVSSVKGNDLNRDSVAIAKMKLLLCVLHKYGVSMVKGMAEVLASCFTCRDFINGQPGSAESDKAPCRYDIILGNPPYVEDSRSESVPQKKYGNIYANVLENAAFRLKPGGVLGFVIPLSYVSTPRMRQIRQELYEHVPKQYILSYSDRPDCLFRSVHQKLCIFFGKNTDGGRRIFTGNYRYWYREERENLFRTAEIIENEFVAEEYIPKLGTKTDADIYRKLTEMPAALSDVLKRRKTGECKGANVFLNMRAAFWMKAFLHEHAGSEYKRFYCEDNDLACLCMCLLNSSLFWWYWVCVSDCWHITGKELDGFRIPDVRDAGDFTELGRLARLLEDKLEETKLYVGTKQTEYEYKHKDCAEVIHQVDGCIHRLYGLTEEEGDYIKKFAYRYRTGEGVKNQQD